MMKHFSWDPQKNATLQKERNISFEVILAQIEEGKVLDIIDHPNQEKYSGQRIFVVDVDNYAYLVPFVESEQMVFLKTIIPSRGGGLPEQVRTGIKEMHNDGSAKHK